MVICTLLSCYFSYFVFIYLFFYCDHGAWYTYGKFIDYIFYKRHSSKRVTITHSIHIHMLCCYTVFSCCTVINVVVCSVCWRSRFYLVFEIETYCFWCTEENVLTSGKHVSQRPQWDSISVKYRGDRKIISGNWKQYSRKLKLHYKCSCAWWWPTVQENVLFRD